jgi:nicotinamide mononucleotide adenylyltransferase
MDEDFEFDANDNNDDDPQWTALTTEQKKELMSAVFEDDEWYSGTPAHIGGQSLPEFGEISARLSAPKSDIQKYYAAWVKMKGLNPQEVMSRGKTMEPAPTAAPPTSAPAPEMIPSVPVSSTSAGVAGQMKGALMNDMLGSMFGGTQQSGGGNDMKYMRGMMMMSNMLESERRQHEAQMQIQREQFAASQNNSIRQEQQQRQDMMMTQQMNFMNNMFKAAAMERVADSMFGQSESTAERILSKVLDTEALGAVVSAGRGVMANRQSQVPAGYDVPSYNPYAQPLNNPPQADMQPEQPAPTGSDNFFEGPEQPQPEVVAEVSDQEFSDTLLEAFRQNMGAQLEDEKTRKALLEQIDIAVTVVRAQNPQLTPQNQLEKMSQQLILVRSLRDIGMGLREASNYLENGMSEATVISGIKDEISKQPVFAQIFQENTYEQMMGLIEPFKDTGGVIHDYNFLLQPEIANLCRSVLTSFKQG